MKQIINIDLTTSEARRAGECSRLRSVAVSIPAAGKNCSYNLQMFVPVPGVMVPWYQESFLLKLNDGSQENF